MSGTMDRFISREPDRIWNQEAWERGVRARKNGFGFDKAPAAGELGSWYRQSWIAGWSDQDMIELSARPTREMSGKGEE